MCKCGFGCLPKDQQEHVYKLVLKDSLPTVRKSITAGVNQVSQPHLVLLEFATRGLIAGNESPRSLTKLLSKPINRLADSVEVAHAVAILTEWSGLFRK